MVIIHCGAAGIDEPIRETHYKGNGRIDEVTPKYALLVLMPDTGLLFIMPCLWGFLRML